MNRYLLDTNHLVDAIRKVSRVRDRIRRLAQKGDRFGTCGPVLCELEAGIQQTGQPAASRRRLNTLLGVVRFWTIDLAVAEVYGALYLELRRNGRTLSQVDMVLAALARQMGLALLTTDLDFQALPDIHTENWLVSPAS
jgi:tRNA(fMet)-specific endonuclease VapC